jgi:Bacterial Ig-like domain
MSGQVHGGKGKQRQGRGTAITRQGRSKIALAAALVATVTLPALGSAQAASAPTTTIELAPPDPTNDATPTFEFSSSFRHATFECAMDNTSAPATCTSPHETAPLGDGRHTLFVRALDAQSTPGEWASHSFTIDTVEPTVTIGSAPAGSTNDTTPEFVFSANEAATFDCALDGAALAGCSSPFGAAALSDGPHSFNVRATDTAGNQGQIATWSFAVDTVAPTATIDGGPNDPTPTAKATPTFLFSSVDATATFECALDGGSFAACSSPYTTAPLADGPHHIEVRAVDPAGNRGPAATRYFTVAADRTAPETVLVTFPPAQTPERTPVFEFVASEANATFECSLDGGAFAACTSPWTSQYLSLGPHRLEVRALDAFGNRDPTPALAEFTVTDLAPTPAPRPNVDAGVRALALIVVTDLDRAARRVGTSEMRTILRRGGLKTAGMRALVPGTLTITASAPVRRSSKAVLKGSTRFGAPGTAPIVLKPTPTGRAMMTRYATVPLLINARFKTADGLTLSANRAAELVRDYLTPAEAKRAVAGRLARLEGKPVDRLSVDVLGRCASNCLKVQARWLAKHRLWSASGRVRQVKGRLLARIGTVVSARH